MATCGQLINLVIYKAQLQSNNPRDFFPHLEEALSCAVVETEPL